MMGGVRARNLPDRKLLLASLVIAVGLVMIGFALVTSISGDEAADLPPAVERVTPSVDAVQVLQQTQIIVDLAEGYEGRLVIDDVALDTIRLDEIGDVDVQPGEQIDLPPGAVFEPGNDTLTFTPGENAPVDRFAPGVHRVEVTYWQTVEGPSRGRTFSWTFEAI